MAGVLFEDIFDVKDIDPDGKKFDRGRGMCSIHVSALFSKSRMISRVPFKEYYFNFLFYKTQYWQ